MSGQRPLLPVCRPAAGGRAGEEPPGEKQGAGAEPAADVFLQPGAAAGDRGNLRADASAWKTPNGGVNRQRAQRGQRLSLAKGFGLLRPFLWSSTSFMEPTKCFVVGKNCALMFLGQGGVSHTHTHTHTHTLLIHPSLSVPAERIKLLGAVGSCLSACSSLALVPAAGNQQPQFGGISASFRDC